MVAQREYKNSMAGGRSITLDVYAKDADGKVYDIEVQREDRGADFHRARFHSKLMHDFRCINSADMFYPLLAKQVRYFKETEGGKEIMCKAFEELAEKRVLEDRMAIAKRMLADGVLSVEMIAKYSNLSIEVVEELAALQTV